MSLSKRCSVLVFVFVLAAGVVPASAQYTVGRVEGTVSDRSGAVLQDATVTLRHLETNAIHTYTTGATGLYVFFALPPGPYELRGEAQGFAPALISVTVLTNQTVVQDLALEVGAAPATTVQVVGAASELDLADAQHSITRSAQEIANLPGLGHNEMSLVHLGPGLVPTNNPRGGSTFGGGGSYVIVLGVQSGLIAANGGRARASSVQLDYTDANDWEGGGFAPGMQAISPDMLQEFKLLTSNLSAEYGVKSNAQIMMVTRSGSNNLHGTAYDFLQNDAFNARDYFDVTGRPTPLKQNIYGFTVGGPVLKDRTFLFTGYEGRRVRGGGFTALASVPSLSARTTTDPTADPLALGLLERYVPLPTASTSKPDVGTVPVQVPSPIDTYQWVVKGDHHFSDKHSIAARYLQSTANFVARFSSLNSLRGFDQDNHFELRNLSLADTLVLTPRTVNELRFAYGHTSAQGRPQGGLNTPRFIISGVVNFGALQTAPSGRIFDVYQVNDQVSHVHGAHVFKFGGDIRQIGDQSLNATNSRGVFTFASVDKFIHGQPSQWTQLFGDTARDFRTGVDGAFVQDDWKLRSTLTLNLGLRWEVQGAQSDANGQSAVLDPRATGGIGAAGSGPLGALRLGGDAVGANPFNIGPRLGFAWNPRAGNLVVRGGYGIYWDSFTFTALNASRSNPPFNYTFSLGASQIGGANSFDNLLNGTAPILAQAQGLLGNFGALTDLGSVTTVDPRLSNPYVQQFSLGFDYRWKTYVLGVGYVGAKGTRLTRLIPVNPVVSGPAPAVSTADELARLLQFRSAVAKENGAGNTRLDPRFDQVSYHDDSGSSIYHSLQVTLRKAISRGVQLQASYTWSKSIDDASDYAPSIQANDNSYAQNGSDLAAERAVSNYDIPHRLAITGIWQVPFFNHQTGVLGKILKGWSFESVNVWQSGLPATLLAGPRTLPVLDPVTHAPVLDPVTHQPTTVSISDVNLDGNLIPTPNGSDNTRADCNPGGVGFIFGNPATIPALNQRGVNGTPNTSNFRYTQPLLGHNGTCGRNTLRMNSLTNFDWSVFKDFTLTEHGPHGSGPWSLQIRGELYNVFNTPFLTAQGDGWRTLSSAAFGLYNSAGATRKLQLALRLSW